MVRYKALLSQEFGRTICFMILTQLTVLIILRMLSFQRLNCYAIQIVLRCLILNSAANLSTVNSNISAKIAADYKTISDGKSCAYITLDLSDSWQTENSKNLVTLRTVCLLFCFFTHLLIRLLINSYIYCTLHCTITWKRETLSN